MTLSGEADAWAAAREGDRRAFGDIYDRHYDRVFRHVVGVTEQRADADEVAASTFFELWRHRDRVRVVNGSVLPWLLVTAGNLARNHGRKVARYRDVLRRLPRDHEWTDPTQIAEEASEAATRSSAIVRVLDRLKPIDAQLVALTVGGELSIVEAAAALGLTAGAARVRLHRARRRLHTELAPLETAVPYGDSA